MPHLPNSVILMEVVAAKNYKIKFSNLSFRIKFSNLKFSLEINPSRMAKNASPRQKFNKLINRSE